MAKGDFVFEVSEGDYARISSALDKLSHIDRNVVIKHGLKKGSQMMLNAGKTSFLSKNRKKTGNLLRSFTDKLNQKKKGITGIFVGFKRGKGKGNHSHLIDKGTTERYTKSGAYRGKIDVAGMGKNGYRKVGKTFFWSSVVSSKGNEAMKNVTDAIYRALDAIR
jgi:hypothetical protein